MNDLWKKWCAAAHAAETALAELQSVQEEFQEEFDNMSEKRQESEKGERLTNLIEIDVDGAIGAIQEALAAEKP